MLTTIPANDMQTEVVAAVKKEIEQVFGRKIVSSRDCNILSEEVFNKTGYKINANTLRRFFGLVKTLYAPSAGTLQILSAYCGFKSCDELVQLHKTRHGDAIVLKEENILFYLLYPFLNIEVKENDETFRSLLKGVIIFINRHPQLANKFHFEIAKTKNGQNFYFERFINYDKLNSFYGEGLRYYLAEKHTPEAQIFGHSLLVFRYWLTKETDKLSPHFRKLKTIKSKQKYNSINCGRYFASKLYNAHAHGFSTEKILFDAHKVYSSLQPPDDDLYSTFEYHFGEALVLTGHFEEGLYFLDNIMNRKPEKPSLNNLPYYEAVNLFQAVALYKTGSTKLAENIFNNLKPSEFDFLSKKYKTILYLLLATYFKRMVFKSIHQLEALKIETGFLRFNDKYFLDKSTDQEV
jgi:hypothetical protein